MSAKKIARETAQKRLLNSLRLEIQRIIEDVCLRENLLMHIWSSDRAREPFIRTLQHRYFEIPLKDISKLPIKKVNAIESFFRELDALTWYIETTEDMPTNMERIFQQHIHALQEKADIVLKIL